MSDAFREQGKVVQLTPLDTAQRGKGPYVWRFTLVNRIVHALALSTFYVLVLTGLPLRFACAPFAAELMRLWGGVHRAGVIHRIAATIMVTYTVIFVGYLVMKVVRAADRKKWLWGSDSLVPHPQDARDFLKQWKWYFTGKHADRPKFGRYGYLEKLDFFGEVWGFVVIGGSGFMLWFPELFSHWMPGWMFNVATVFHGVEALIAACFIFIVHFFNVHLRPDKFPLDAVMFHGRATVAYMEEEHPAMLGDLRTRQPVSHEPVVDLPAPPPSRRVSIVAATFGFIALGVGIACIGMILWAVAFC